MHRCRRFTATVITVEQVGRRNGSSQMNTFGVLMTVRENFIIADRGNEKNRAHSCTAWSHDIEYSIFSKTICASRPTKLNEYKFPLSVHSLLRWWSSVFNWNYYEKRSCSTGSEASDQRRNDKFNYNSNEFVAETVTGLLWEDGAEKQTNDVLQPVIRQIENRIRCRVGIISLWSHTLIRFDWFDDQADGRESGAPKFSLWLQDAATTNVPKLVRCETRCTRVLWLIFNQFSIADRGPSEWGYFSHIHKQFLVIIYHYLFLDSYTCKHIYLLYYIFNIFMIQFIPYVYVYMCVFVFLYEWRPIEWEYGVNGNSINLFYSLSNESAARYRMLIYLSSFVFTVRRCAHYSAFNSIERAIL